jgi:hypothetical protein
VSVAAADVVVTLADGLSLVLPAADGSAPSSDAAGAGAIARGGSARSGGPAHAYPTARLQKGLLLFDGTRGLAEEGVGFGVPVLKRGVRAVFAGGAAVDVRDEGRLCTVRVVYRIDLVERLAVSGGGTVAPRSLYAVKDALAAMHRRVPAARGLLTTASTALRRRFGWETVYVPSGPAAEVPVTFVVDRDRGTVHVHADFSGLPPEVTEVAVMNEQGARAFDRYEDAAGLVLCGGAIGSWDEVAAPGARFVSPSARVAFSAEHVEGATLRRGRELVGVRLAWAGFALTAPAGRRGLSYELRVGRVP